MPLSRLHRLHAWLHPTCADTSEATPACSVSDCVSVHQVLDGLLAQCGTVENCEQGEWGPPLLPHGLTPPRVRGVTEKTTNMSDSTPKIMKRKIIIETGNYEEQSAFYQNLVEEL